MSSTFFPTHRSLSLYAVCSVFLLLLPGFVMTAQANPSSAGFWKNDNSPQATSPLTASQIAQFLPDKRGPFQFPAPYNTTGIRVTLPSDCPNSSNCVNYVGYSYWATMSNSAGSDHMWIMVGLLPDKGGAGPTLYNLNKKNDKVSKIGPIFTSHAKFQSGETMYFSHSMPDALYYLEDGGTTLNYIDVATRKKTRVFDIRDYIRNDHIFQCSTSNDDKMSACTLEDSNWKPVGCVAYSKTKGFQFYSQKRGFDECHVGAAGKYVLIDANHNTIIWNLETGKTYTILNKAGGGGHYATGYGYYTQNNNRDKNYDSVKLWKFGQPKPIGDVFDQPWTSQCVGSKCTEVPSHPSWLNAVPISERSISEQYVCDSTRSGSLTKPFSHAVFCYFLTAENAPARKKALVIAPTMIDPDKRGCPGGAYGQYAKGNIDPTGHYFMWSSNLKSNDTCQVFIVKIPVSRFPHPPPVVTPPQVSITTPAAGASASGTVAAAAKVQGDLKILSVTWRVDEKKIGSSSSPPYSREFNAANFPLGSNTLTAIAKDTAGNTGIATSQFNVVEKSSPPPPPTSPPSAPSISNSSGGGGSLSLLTLAGLWLFAALGVLRKRR
jgi:hypothetical protein